MIGGPGACPVSSCAGPTFPALTDINDTSFRVGSAASHGRLLLLFAPILVVLGGVAVLLAIALAYPAERAPFVVAAEILGALAGALAMATLYRQIRGRQAAQSGWESAQARAGDLAESAMDPIIAIDEAQRVVLFNTAAESTFGWKREQVIGQPIEMLLPERFHPRHREHIDDFAQTGSTLRRMGGHAVLAGLRATGEEFPIEASISQHREGGERRLTVILRDVSARVRAMDDLRKSKEELQALGVAAQEMRELEKSRIARELHDELGQLLTMLRMDVAWCKANLDTDGPGVADKLERMETLLKTTVTATRRIASDLRPLMLDDLGLVPALEWLVQNMSQRAGIPCDFTVDDAAIALPPAHSSAVFRTIQEALTNIVRHAKATRAEVVVWHDQGSVHVTIRDDGVGFAARDPRKPTSYGLLGLRERATLLRGTTTIQSEPGAGTTIELVLPLPGSRYLS